MAELTTINKDKEIEDVKIESSEDVKIEPSEDVKELFVWCPECYTYITNKFTTSKLKDIFTNNKHKDSEGRECVHSLEYVQSYEYEEAMNIIKKTKTNESANTILKKREYPDSFIVLLWKIYNKSVEVKEIKEPKVKSQEKIKKTDEELLEIQIKRILDNSDKEFKNAKITYDKIFGNEQAKHEIREFQRLRRIANSNNLESKHGFVLYGVTRTGKGTLTEAMFHEDLNPDTDIIVVFKSAMIISGNLKESASNVENLMTLCRTIRDRTGKAIHIILDEAEKKIPNRDSTSHNQSILSSSWLEEFGGRYEINKIYMYALTNHINKFDKAMISDGRLSEMIKTELPDDEIRILTFRTLLSNLNIENIDYVELSKMTDKMNIKFIIDVIDDIKIFAVSEDITKDKIYELTMKAVEKNKFNKEELREAKEESKRDGLVDEYNIVESIVDLMKFDIIGITSSYTPKELRGKLFNIERQDNLQLKLSDFKSEDSIGMLLNKKRIDELKEYGITLIKHPPKNSKRLYSLTKD